MAPRLRIGLTGGIASGKTTVGRRFIELGVPVINADESARRVVVPGSPGLAEIVRAFGRQLLDRDGVLDRPALRELIFSDPARRRQLEDILHPLIRCDMDTRASEAVGPYLVLEIPLLVENPTNGRVDRILVVDLPESMQQDRAVARDGVSVKQVRSILESQASRETRLKAADDILSNSGTVSELRLGVDALHDRYLKLAGKAPG